MYVFLNSQCDFWTNRAAAKEIIHFIQVAGGRGGRFHDPYLAPPSAAGLLEPPPLLDLSLAPSVLLQQGGHDF